MRQLRAQACRDLPTDPFTGVFGWCSAVATIDDKSPKIPANRKADARVRTADPFITSDQVDVERSLQIGLYRGSQTGLNPL